MYRLLTNEKCFQHLVVMSEFQKSDNILRSLSLIHWKHRTHTPLSSEHTELISYFSLTLLAEAHYSISPIPKINQVISPKLLIAFWICTHLSCSTLNYLVMISNEIWHYQLFLYLIIVLYLSYRISS